MVFLDSAGGVRDVIFRKQWKEYSQLNVDSHRFEKEFSRRSF
jgi:hypothetical protein